MRVEVTTGGITLRSPDGRVSLENVRPAVRYAVGGEAIDWRPTRFEAGADAVAVGDDGHGLRLGLRAGVADGGGVTLVVELTNDGSLPVRLNRLVVFESPVVRVGDDPTRWRTYRNGHQSWSGTVTMGADDSDRDIPTRFGRSSATDARHRSPTHRGHVRSDWLSAVCEPISGDALAVGFTIMDVAFGFIELTGIAQGRPSLSAWADFDDVELAPGTSTPTLQVHIESVTDDRSAGWHALGRVAEVTGKAMGARSVDQPHPAGWCSWYYYFAKVTEADVVANLEVLATDGRDGPLFGCEYVMIDDGHQRAIGDWLDTDTDKFPSGMPALAERICGHGFDAGLWWAPFIVSARSRVARDHPEWLVRNGHGRPIVALVNPNWGITARMFVLDTTNPIVADHIAATAAAIDRWGYRIQKLDFLFAASLPGIRHDSGATRAVALRRGLEAVRRGAGEASFLLGCGCPLGPAVGVVDAMRIGADVTPYWSNVIDSVAGRGLHGLATRNAVRNTLTRAVLDRAWWLNDPDCLMVRDADTKLTLDEVRILCTVFGMTNGMVVLSDRLDQVSADRRGLVAKTRALSGGEVEVVDLFEGSMPEVLVSRHPDRIDVGALNLGEVAGHRVVDLDRLGLAASDRVVTEYWTGVDVTVAEGRIDFGTVPAHGAAVVSIPT